ncbi:MAG: LacI family DNA-binding transcriptional regulator [Chloroflexi bacterium]|nr:MAG: LacI family DNA-binding transcriptional regulator [Chloroflexota bacterium]
MASKRVTSFDVADLAGVSQSTVSRAFTPEAKVSKKTRQKVFAAATKLGYQPDAIARSLSTRHTNIIGIVMAHITSPFYPYVLDKFTQRLQEMGRQILLFNAAAGQDVDDILPLVLQYRVDGLIITSATISSEMADVLARDGTPVILFNRYVLGANCSAVCCDNVDGARKIADFLLDNGHKRPAYIAGDANTSTNIDREKGFGDRLRERGIIQWYHEQGEYTYQSGYDATLRLMQLAKPPDAIFCANDVMALGALDAARHALGLRVPEDLSIIGFDDIPAASWPSYMLTTIRQPVTRMIDATLDLLLERLDNPKVEPALKLIPGPLIQRNSTRVAETQT